MANTKSPLSFNASQAGKNKIILFHRKLDYGGSQRQLITLAIGLHDRGHEVMVVTFYPGGPLEKDLLEHNIPLKTLNKRGQWDLLFFFVRLFSLIRRERPTLLHGYSNSTNLLCGLLKCFFPSIKCVFGIRWSDMDWEARNWFVRANVTGARMASRFADVIIVNSIKGISVHSALGYPRQKMVFIPNAIDTEKFSPNPADRQRIRAEFGVSPDEIVIGRVGNASPEKDDLTFLRAAEIFQESGEKVRFLYVGARIDKALEPRLLQTLRLLCVGTRLDMPSVYNAMDIATSSSSSEGFSNVIGEAMASGIPCVVTDIGESAGIVGDTGVVVPSQDPESLAAGWSQCISERTPDTAQRTRRQIVENFSVEQLVENTEKALGISSS